MADHQLVLTREATATVSRCSCGWESAPTRLPGHAEKRWRIHVGERRAAASIVSCHHLSTAAEQRTAELVVVREAARIRRAELRAQRERLRVRVDAPVASRASVDASGRAAIIALAQVLAGVSPQQLWIDYFGLGGSAPPSALESMLHGSVPLPQVDHDVLVVALNERFAEAGFGYPLDAWKDLESP